MTAHIPSDANKKITASTSSLDHEKHPLPNVTRPASRDRSVTGDVPPRMGGTSRKEEAMAMTGSVGAKPTGTGVDVAPDRTSRHESGDVAAGGSGDFVIDDTFDAEPATSPIPRWLAQQHRADEIDTAALLQRALALLAADEILRKQLHHVAPQEKTEAKYAEKVTILRKRYMSKSGEAHRPVLEALAPYAAKEQSWKVMRAALKWHLLRRIEFRVSQVRACEAARQATPPEISLRLSSAVRSLEELVDLQRTDAREFAVIDNRPPHSKKDLLPELPDDWRDRFERRNSESPKYRMVGVLLVACGLRPEELEKGVALRWTASDEIEVTIAGAKVTEVAGQPWRSLRLDPARLPRWFSHHLQTERSCVVQAKPSCLAAHLARLSNKVFEPDRDGNTPRLSAYLFRHALVTDLREAGWRSDEIAAAIGETSAETVSWYGLRRGGPRKLRPNIAIRRDSVATARPVRPAKQNWPQATPSKSTPSSMRTRTP
jgi:hypothetical protein